MTAFPQFCVFCGHDESFGKITKEHFVPKCLWNDQRPQETLTVPAHDECNRKHSDDNEYFRDMLAISDDCSEHPEVIKLINGKIARKLKKRRGAFIKSLQNVRIRVDGPTIDWDWQRMEIVLQNIMKGLFFRFMEHPMPQNMRMEIGHVRCEADLVPIQIVDTMCDWVGFGDDVFGCRCIFHSAGEYMFCLMKFYQSITFFGKAVLSATPLEFRVSEPG